MTHWELTRLVCYTVGAPAALYVMLYMVRLRSYAWATFLGGLALLWIWYMVEITIASTGINTREYRVIGTPLVLMSTVALLVMAWQVRKARRMLSHERKEKMNDGAG